METNESPSEDSFLRDFIDKWHYTIEFPPIVIKDRNIFAIGGKIAELNAVLKADFTSDKDLFENSVLLLRFPLIMGFPEKNDRIKDYLPAENLIGDIIQKFRVFNPIINIIIHLSSELLELSQVRGMDRIISEFNEGISKLYDNIFENYRRESARSEDIRGLKVLLELDMCGCLRYSKGIAIFTKKKKRVAVYSIAAGLMKSLYDYSEKRDVTPIIAGISTDIGEYSPIRGYIEHLLWRSGTPELVPDIFVYNFNPSKVGRIFSKEKILKKLIISQNLMLSYYIDKNRVLSVIIGEGGEKLFRNSEKKVGDDSVDRRMHEFCTDLRNRYGILVKLLNITKKSKIGPFFKK